MTALQLRIYETVTQRPNGDRDTQRHPSSAFEVVLVNGDKRTTIFKNDQYDHWWSTIQGNRLTYLKEAMDAASRMAETLGGCEIIGIDVTHIESEIMELQKRINSDMRKLNELKVKYGKIE